MAYDSRKTLAILASLALSALTAPSASAAQENSIIGRWFTEGVERGVHIQVFLDNKPDGSYEKDIRAIEKCEVAGRGKETGKWTFQNGDFATTSEAVDGKPATGSPADLHDLFNVTRVDESHINLYDTETKLNWALLLVTDSYAFPPPRGCSI